MGETTEISWTHSTFNPWTGCEKVSPGCANCYAEADAHRWGKDVWGPEAKREKRTESYWRQPHKWNEKAKASGKPWRVFCASQSDVFEDRRDLDADRSSLFRLIEATPALTWLLLTKRPENVLKLAPSAWLPSKREPLHEVGHGDGYAGAWPDRVWIGATVEDEPRTKRIQDLMKVPARTRFLSCEPLLGPVDLSPFLRQEEIAFCNWCGLTGPIDGDARSVVGEACSFCGDARLREGRNAFDWVIVGGESGANARPCPVDAIRSVVDQCAAGGVPCFVKQLGTRVWVDFYADEPLAEWSRERERCVWDSDGMGKVGGIEAVCKWHPRDGQPRAGAVIEVALRSRKGADPAEWPEDLRVRQWPRIRTCWEKVK